MKPHPRIRKTIKWGGLALGLLLAGVWVRSEWVGGYWEMSGWQLNSQLGRVAVSHDRDPNRDRARLFFALRLEADGRWWWQWIPGPPGGILLIPLWIPLTGALFATAAAWRLDALARRRARAGLCSKCHYDRAGLASSAVCPECGAAAPAR
jgi:hypothetical protein